MGLPSVDVNYLAVLVVTVVSFVIGMLWYSPVLFGNAWMKAGGISKKDIEKSKKEGMEKKMLTSFVGSLLMGYILSYFVVYATATTFVMGMKVGLWLWLGFVVPVLVGSVLWEGKVVRYYLINISYWLVNIAVMGGILAVWG